mmetsp:Transcript_16530/g.24294  ORF Transcript_16530/g.24294 Transcript_16530/m.24294 type:complete len:218 (+) Transcript_16530:3-656(+)
MHGATSAGGNKLTPQNLEDLRRWTLERELENLQNLKPKSAAKIAGKSAIDHEKTTEALLLLEWSSCYSHWRPIASGLPQTGSYLWTIPAHIEQGLYLVRLREMRGSRLLTPGYPVTVRDKFEFVTPSPAVDCLAWEVRSTHCIEWRSFGSCEKAQLYLEAANGTQTPLAKDLKATGSWEWAISGRVSAGWYRLKVRDSIYCSVEETSSWFSVITSLR